jgi:hypothetical protein
MRSGTQVVLRYLRDTKDFQKALELGFIGYPAFPLKQPEYREGVLELLRRRLPPRSRSDFGEYLQRFGLPRNATLSDFALLGYSEAKLPSDGFSVVNDFEDVKGDFEFVTEIAGFRYYGGMSMVIPEVIGSPVGFRPEPANKHDRNAVRVELNGVLIGYVNRLQSCAFLRWLEAGHVSAQIHRIDGSPVRPQVHMFVSVTNALGTSFP